MKITRYLIAASVGAVLLTTAQCKKETPKKPDTFKKETLLTNVADNYIIPGYAELQLNVNALNTSWSTFAADETADNFNGVRSAWQAAAISFQKVKFLEVGPAMTIGFSAALGTFPTDTAQIESNITGGSYDLATAANIDAIGFDALDFLLYGADAYAKLVNSAARRLYVQNVIAKMKSETDQVVNAWSSYKATFIAGTGTETTSAFSVLVNAFCKDFEIAKSAKIGAPIGTATLGVPLPEYFEARRSGIGKALLIANLTGLRRLFTGTPYSGAGGGTGFDDYLVAIDRTTLGNTIDQRFIYLTSEPANWLGTIEEKHAASPEALTAYYQYMQGTVVYIKTDMASAFGVLITYQDNDGD